MAQTEGPPQMHVEHTLHQRGPTYGLPVCAQQPDLKIRGRKALAMRKGGSTITFLTLRLPGPSAGQPPGEGRVEMITKGRRSLYMISRPGRAISHPLLLCTLIPEGEEEEFGTPNKRKMTFLRVPLVAKKLVR